MIPWGETFSFCSLSVGFAALNPRLNKDDALSGNATLNRGRPPGRPYSYAQGRVGQLKSDDYFPAGKNPNLAGRLSVMIPPEDCIIMDGFRRNHLECGDDSLAGNILFLLAFRGFRCAQPTAKQR